MAKKRATRKKGMNSDQASSNHSARAQEAATHLARERARTAKLRRVYESEGVRATVLFADLKDSTRYKQRREPLLGMVKTTLHNELLTEAIEAHNGKVIKYIGDGVMAMFASATADRDAIAAGVAAIKELALVNEANGWAPDDFDSLHTRIGVHSGPVWMYEFEQATVEDPQGPTVDIAARLCALSRPDEIVCSVEVFDAAGEIAPPAGASAATLRLISGVAKPMPIRAIGLGVDGNQRAPYKSHDRPTAPEIIEELRQIRGLVPLVAIGRLETITNADPGCYEANMCMAENLILAANGDPRKAQLLDRAIDHLCAAKQVQDRPCRPWLLQSWARFKLYESNGPTALWMLDAAIRLAEEAIDRASAYHDEAGLIQSWTYFATYQLARARHGEVAPEDREAALVLANDHCERVARRLDRQNKICRADYLVTHALAKLELLDVSQATDKEVLEIRTMVTEALELDPYNLRGLDAQAEIVRRSGRQGVGPVRRPD